MIAVNIIGESTDGGGGGGGGVGGTGRALGAASDLAMDMNVDVNTAEKIREVRARFTHSLMGICEMLSDTLARVRLDCESMRIANAANP